MIDTSSTAGSALKRAGVGESEASVEGHVTQQRRGSANVNHTATRTTSPSVMSRSVADSTAVDETHVQHEVIVRDSSVRVFVRLSVCFLLNLTALLLLDYKLLQ